MKHLENILHFRLLPGLSLRFSLIPMGLLLSVIALMGQEDIKFREHRLEYQIAGNGNAVSIIQDRRGWIWIANMGNGLVRYDGKQFKSYTHDREDPRSIENNHIWSIHEGHAGKLWLATDESLDLFDPETEQFIHYRHDPNDTNSLTMGMVRCVLEGSNGFVWVGTDHGLNKLDPDTDKIRRYLAEPENPSGLSNDRVKTIYEDGEGRIWLGMIGGDLNYLDPVTDRFTRILPDQNDSEVPLRGGVGGMYEDHQGRFWVGAWGGLNLFDPVTKKFDRFLPEGGESLLINDICEDAAGNLWLATNRGLYRFETKTRQFIGYLPAKGQPANSIANDLVSIMRDREGNIWTGGQALYSFIWKDCPLQHYKHDPSDAQSLSHNGIITIYKDSRGRHWIGTRRGLNLYDPNSRSFKRYFPDPENKSDAQNSTNWIQTLYEDSKRNFWVGTAKGLLRFDRDQERFLINNPIRDQAVRSIREDRHGAIWVGVFNGGLFRLDPEENTVSRYLYDETQSLGANTIQNIIDGQNGRFWISTLGSLLEFDPESRKVLQSFEHDREAKTSISDEFILGPYRTRTGDLWVSTNDGLNLFNAEDSSFIHYFETDGLSSALIRGLSETIDGDLVIGLRTGLSILDRETNRFRNYPALNGIDLISMTGIFTDEQTGELWFGSFVADGSGLFIIHPDSLPYNDAIPPVYISQLSTYDHKNQKAGFAEIKAPWSQKSLTLPHHQNTLTAEFAILSYKDPTQNQAAYRLEGIQDDWINIGAKREATFSNLRPGKYTLRVKGSNNDGLWNEEGVALQITVLPPWWLTLWAKIAYVLLAAALLYNLYRYQLKRKLALAETHRLQELDQVKNKFFTNITHEFRTPLTVIQGMAEQEMDREGNIPPAKNLENAQLIRRNSAQLLTLVNQLLDLRKLESGVLPVRMVQGDVVQYLRYLTESFDSHARNKGVGLHFLCEEEELLMDYDPEKLLYIVSNLLSNAVKFTPAGGNVYFNVSSDTTSDSETADVLKLVVKDTGIGIEEDKLPRIFDRFYQADDSATKGEGSGIGLALTRELVKLLGGTITVSSKLEKGTSFTVTLPITREAEEETVERAGMMGKVLGFVGPAAQEISKKTNTFEVLPGSEEDLPLALLIEDNPDVIRYLSSCLEADYKILTALDGQTGIDTALDMIPDIIISDVMMPNKDGYEVCDILKNDERTSHIPIILLTAKADQESKLAGLKKGADAYLAKPFHREELTVRLEQLIELRKKLQESYGGLLPEEIHKARSSIEADFLRKVRRAIEENLSDSEYGIAQLCRAVGLSRSQLFRKLKALTGKSTTLVIRSIRLQHARRLLLSTGLNVSEVAYEVGFKDPNYFSKCFQEEYGEAPSSVRAG